MASCSTRPPARRPPGPRVSFTRTLRLVRWLTGLRKAPHLPAVTAWSPRTTPPLPPAAAARSLCGSTSPPTSMRRCRRCSGSTAAATSSATPTRTRRPTSPSSASSASRWRRSTGSPRRAVPAATDDAYAALRWLHSSAADLGVDPARRPSAAQSAGGGLAAGVALLAQDGGEVPLAFQLLIYPMLTTAPSCADLDDRHCCMWDRQSNHFGWSASPRPGRARRASAEYAAPPAGRASPACPHLGGRRHLRPLPRRGRRLCRPPRRRRRPVRAARHPWRLPRLRLLRARPACPKAFRASYVAALRAALLGRPAGSPFVI